MIQNVLRHLGGIENYGIVSLLLFLACFLGMLIWALCLRKPFLEAMSHLPLENGPNDQDPGIQSHE
ncbi:MAG: hypothetical protein MUE94_00290 [Verrucomicrobia bacterium]|jgi:hypothetical protein|nr:hypothetical protein [Verrucomicrobiota bacterium]